MKIICLNTWGGRAGHRELLAFFEREKESTDIFCLQEMWRAPYDHLHGQAVGGVVLDISSAMSDGLQRISKILTNHDVYFHPHNGDNYGLALFVKKNRKVIAFGDIFVDKERGYIVPPGDDPGTAAKNVQYVTLLQDGGEKVTVANFHGLWNGKGKNDSDERLAQSEKIVNFLESLGTEIVLCGDFNLLPNTKSIEILENAGLRNLIKEYGITSTRTSFYTKSEKHADYAFVSQGVEVESFRVLPDEVSDHAPLELIVK